MKDFAADFINNKPPELDSAFDPFLYTTPEVIEQIQLLQNNSINTIYNLPNIIAIILTAPLQTIITSMQLSVKSHKNIFESPNEKTKEVARINTSLTVQEKRKLELQIRSGGTHRPYTAPVYEGYRAVIKDLLNQGYKSFLKGLLFRLVHQSVHLIPMTALTIENEVESDFIGLNIASKLFKQYALMCVGDIIFNSFQIMQNRYILQNNIAQFRVFRSAFKAIKKILMRNESLIGCGFHLFNNFFQCFFKFPILFVILNQKQFNPFLFATYYGFQLLTYPFTTAYKRLICQSSDIPGMIPLRYGGVSHAVRLIASEEGVLGLWKGFGLHHVNFTFRILALKIVHDQFFFSHAF